MIDIIITSSWILILAAICAMGDGFMDKMNFHWKHNDGYFSLRYPIRSFLLNDAWHDTKKLIITIIFVVVSYLKYGVTLDALVLFVLLAIINYIFHEFILHWIP